MRRSSELIVADLVNGRCIDDFVVLVYVLDDPVVTPFPTLFHRAASEIVLFSKFFFF